MSSPGKLVGIDLGTTFSAIATLDERGQAITLPNVEGEMLTPSVIFFENNTAVVGAAARDVALEQPERVASLVKRWMGHPNYGKQVGGRQFRPETLSAIILRKLVQDAERRIGPIKQAVITVPAYFDDTRRKATKDAGRIAGLDVLDIIDEPTAAALAYSFQPPHGHNILAAAPPLAPPCEGGARGVLSPPCEGGARRALSPPWEGGARGGAGREQSVLVYDLGGGTFDVTLVRLAHKHFQSVGIEGDVRLGGKDWDDCIVNYVAAKFRGHYGDDPRSDPLTLANLQAAAERAKRTLSKLTQTSITCTHQGKVLTVPLTRAEFESLSRQLLLRTRWITQELVKQAGYRWEQIDRILLVGGSTHMPMTSRMLHELCGKDPDNSLAVSEVVARGAALHAGIVTAHAPKQDRQMLDPQLREAFGKVVEINVNSHSLGIEVKLNQERRNDILVRKNTQLPTAASRVYRTVVANQGKVRVKVLQGEAPKADSCISIGECWIEGLPPNLPKHSPIQVRCGVGSNGLVDVMALDMTSGKMVRTTIHRSSGLAEEEIAREAEWVKSLVIQ